MNCREIRKIISAHVDGEPDGREQLVLKDHLATCRQCRNALTDSQKVWQMLGEVEAIDPDPNYMAHFWDRVDARQPWYKKIRFGFKGDLPERRWVPALALACLLIVFSTVALHYLSQAPPADTLIATLSDLDLDMVASVEILENFEIIQEIDFLSDLEFIERIDQLDAS